MKDFDLPLRGMAIRDAGTHFEEKAGLSNPAQHIF